MQNLNIDDGSITLCINQDQGRLLKFNPRDLNFAKRFYSFMDDFSEKETELHTKAKRIDSKMEYDENGVPVNIGDIFELMTELDTYFREKLDFVFGEGTSNTVFGTVNLVSRDSKGNTILNNFIEGVAPFIESARKTEVTKHTAKYNKKARKPSVD